MCGQQRSRALSQNSRAALRPHQSPLKTLCVGRVAESLLVTAASPFPSSPHPHHRRPLAHCQSMGQRKVRPTEVLPRVQPGCRYTGLAVVLSNPALVFPLTASLPENAASSGQVPRAAVSPLDGQIDGQTAWAGFRLCGSGGALCTPPPPRPVSRL